jgi:hypothetical protein
MYSHFQDEKTGYSIYITNGKPKIAIMRQNEATRAHSP